MRMQNALLYLLCTCCWLSAAQANKWTPKAGGHWQFSWQKHFDCRDSRWHQSAVLSFPRGTTSNPPESAELIRTLSVPQEGCSIALSCRSYALTLPGYFEMSVSMDGREVWRQDAYKAADKPIDIRLPITQPENRRKQVTVSLKAINVKTVSNLPAEVAFESIRLITPQSEFDLLPKLDVQPPRPLPAELALPVTEPRGLEWTSTAAIVQPWDRSQYTILKDPEPWARRLRDDFGLNTLHVQPPVAFNRGKYKVPDDEFRFALDTYRKAGFRIVLYSSIMHCGHAPEWQTGQLTKQQPDWFQVDVHGNRIDRYGNYWMCPNTGALDYTLRYTQGLVRDYQPDGIMLDNNEFLYATEGERGVTCYCAGCQAKFKAYIQERFGETTQDYFGISPEAVTIPTEQGLLFNIWIEWRKRAWAEANEYFRQNLPGVALFANTQYVWRDFSLAVDDQYRHEDMILSESRGLTSEKMSVKMLVGKAMAMDRPVWNYLGTFNEKDKYLLRPLEEITRIVAASNIQLVQPFLCFHGYDLDEERNAVSSKAVQRHLRFRRQHQSFFDGVREWAATGVLISTRMRDFMGLPLTPRLGQESIRAGLPVRFVRAEYLADADLSEFTILLAEKIYCLSEPERQAMLAWVRSGGTLITTGNLGVCDEIGRPLPASPLLDLLKTDAGRGRLVIENDADQLIDRAAGLSGQRFVLAGIPEGQVECRPVIAGGRRAVHLVNHGKDITSKWRLQIPQAIDGRAEYFSPESDQAVILAVRDAHVEMPPMNAQGLLLLDGENK